MIENFTSILDLGLPTRINNILLVEGIDSVEKLIDLDDLDLIRIANLGKKSREKIARHLNSFKKTNELPIIDALKSINEKINSMEKTIIMLSDFLDKILGNPMTNLSHEVNNLRTVVLEQYRLLQDIQIEKSPDGILKKINEKIPGFSSTMYDVYQKLETL
jgi:hypothetical protein